MWGIYPFPSLFLKFCCGSNFASSLTKISNYSFTTLIANIEHIGEDLTI